jgi:hypothetical protein
MARRPIFIPTPERSELVKVVPVDLTWHSGFALVQKRKNVRALHDAAARLGYSPILEISTKSDEKLGQHLSAFHLKVSSSRGPLPLESAYQGSKVFEGGGPYVDLYTLDVRSAKRDSRLQASGRIIGFEFDGFRFPSEPKTAFYDWLYVNAIFEHREWLRSRLSRYAGFTDIEFNPERSINCQAHSCALFAALMANGQLEAAVASPHAFIEIIRRRTARSVSTEEDSRPFARVFSRLYELKDAVPDPTHPDAYFQNFEKRLEESEHIRNQYMKVERPLEALDENAWHDILERAAPLTVQRHATRGWQSLFDTLNEAKAYAYLQRLGCSDIAFIERASKRTPDLRAVLDGRPVLCEVKTVNVSQDETDRRDRIQRGEIFVTSVEASVTSGMLNKVTSTLVHAIEQLDREDPNRTARRFVFTVLHFDDWVGDYQTEYIAQLDAHLAANPIAGAELVFCPASDLFERRFMMRSATVVEI